MKKLIVPFIIAAVSATTLAGCREESASSTTGFGPTTTPVVTAQPAPAPTTVQVTTRPTTTRVTPTTMHTAVTPTQVTTSQAIPTRVTTTRATTSQVTPTPTTSTRVTPTRATATPYVPTTSIPITRLTTPVEESTLPTTSSPDVTQQASLATAWVPALCGNQAGNLVDGKLPRDLLLFPHVNARAELSGASQGDIFQVTSDINGDGRLETAAVYQCDHGGASWPSQVVLYNADFNYLGMVSPEDMSLEGYVMRGSQITVLEPRGDALYMQWRGWRINDANCCATGMLAGEIVMRNGVPTITNVEVLA